MPIAALWDVLSLQGVIFPSSNVTSGAGAGFEEKEGVHAAFVRLTSTTFHTQAVFSLALQEGTREITAALAKTLPGVTAGERISVSCKLYTDADTDSKSGSLSLTFYNEDGEQCGVAVDIEQDETNEWTMKKKNIIVPISATRINMSLVAECDGGETVGVWCGGVKITR